MEIILLKINLRGKVALRRQRRSHSKNFKFFYIAGLILLVLTIILIVMYRIYNKHLGKISESMLSSEEITGLLSVEDKNKMTEEVEL